MGERVSFKMDGVEVSGYLATPSKPGPAVIVIHEWWGLDSPLSNIKELADRFAQEGFVAFAPDYYKGKNADNPDDAGKLMMDMFQNRLKEVENMTRASVKWLKERDDVNPKKVGVTGFCCGGTLSMYLPTVVELDASVPFYGLPQLAPIKAENIKCPIFFICAEKDEFVNNDEVIDIAKKVWKNGVPVQIKIYPGVNHAFLNDKRPEVFNKQLAEDAWKLTVDFFRTYLV